MSTWSCRCSIGTATPSTESAAPATPYIPVLSQRPSGGFSRTDILDSALPQATFPFLVTFGDNDIYGDHTQIVIDRYPNATVEFWAECGHLPWLDAPARFENQLKAFYNLERDS